MTNNPHQNGNGHTDTPKALKIGTVAINRVRTAQWKKKFIEVFRQTGIVRAAAEAAGIAREIAYRHRDKDPKFAMEWQKAIDDSTELLELHCLRRATQGEPRALWMNTKEGPKKVGEEMVKSDRLLEFMLRARKPMVYRDNVTAELTGKDGAPIAPVVQAQTVVFNIPQNFRQDPAHQKLTEQNHSIDIPTEAVKTP